ncbi:13319_t:CDS:2, partial [Funneliformis geosporum]
NLKKELLTKVKPGTKPSDIKKLKRSKSANDLPNSLPEQEAFLKELWLLLHPQTKSLSLDQPINQEELKKALKSQLDHLKELRNCPPPTLLTDQLKEKQQEIEQLRKALEAKNTELAHTKSELDQSLEARCQALTTFGHEHEKRNKAEQELNETVEEAASELKHGDQETSRLRSELFKANQQVNSLQHELSLARINRNRNLPDSTLEHPFAYCSDSALSAQLATVQQTNRTLASFLKNELVNEKENLIKRTKQELSEFKNKYSKKVQQLDAEQVENNKLSERIEKLEKDIEQLRRDNAKPVNDFEKVVKQALTNPSSVERNFANIAKENAQEFLNEKLPAREKRAKITSLCLTKGRNCDYTRPEDTRFGEIDLEGELDLSDFINLNMLFIEGQPNLTKVIGLEKCEKLLVPRFEHSEYEREETSSQTSQESSYSNLPAKIAQKKQELAQLRDTTRKPTKFLRKEIELLEKLQTLENKVSELEEKEVNYRQQISQKEQTISQKQGQIEQLKNEKNTQKKAQEKAEQKIKKSLEDIKRELAESQTQNQTNEQTYQQSLTEKNEELRQRNEAFRVLQERNAGLQANLAKASEEVSELAKAKQAILSLEEQLSAKQPKSYWWVYLLLAAGAVYLVMKNQSRAQQKSPSLPFKPRASPDSSSPRPFLPPRPRIVSPNPNVLPTQVE